MAIITNLEYNTLKRDVKRLRVHAETMRKVLEQIAVSRRGGLNKRLASSCLVFLEQIDNHPRKLRSDAGSTRGNKVSESDTNANP